MVVNFVSYCFIFIELTENDEVSQKHKSAKILLAKMYTSKVVFTICLNGSLHIGIDVLGLYLRIELLPLQRLPLQQRQSLRTGSLRIGTIFTNGTTPITKTPIAKTKSSY